MIQPETGLHLIDMALFFFLVQPLGFTFAFLMQNNWVLVTFSSYAIDKIVKICYNCPIQPVSRQEAETHYEYDSGSDAG